MNDLDPQPHDRQTLRVFVDDAFPQLAQAEARIA
jgi:hypothetical protein